ncbi:GLOBIN domain-containing protein [Chloropicon primus]|uniref:Globin domain-containing protein n=1 Tax=Chloropicon primus TaxID=1764295 RepID=A0A5B8MJN4_9CHLO|nr:hypothetical protein A3770_04p32040 [Chloropicon primus]UPQ99898.1 GLOBIN domain-containing protein [Chloropicon primus]|eukprot:QDZ20686.1 hypothetical protein A3770_04p32040 [Chloropicon primus]
MKEHGYEITQEMYATMFEEHEDIKALFNHDNMVVHPGETKKKQPLLLAQAVHAYAENIDNLSLLESAVDRITKKHVSANVKPEHYGIVGRHLLNAVKKVLGEKAKPEICDAWEKAFNFLAELFIETENNLRKEEAAKKEVSNLGCRCTLG